MIFNDDPLQRPRPPVSACKSPSYSVFYARRIMVRFNSIETLPSPFFEIDSFNRLRPNHSESPPTRFPLFFYRAPPTTFPLDFRSLDGQELIKTWI